MNDILNYPPTIEDINETLLEPFLDKELKVSYKLEDGSIETSKGFLSHHSKFSDIGEHDGDYGVYLLEYTDPFGVSDQMILNYFVPFDQEDDNPKSLIVTDGTMDNDSTVVLLEMVWNGLEKPNCSSEWLGFFIAEF